MLGSKWTFAITNLEGTRIGEIANAYEREYIANLSKPSTASFKVRRDNPIIPYLFSKEEDYMLQVYQDSTLRMWGPILTANFTMEEGAPPSVAITAADPAYRLSKRTAFEPPTGLVLNGLDKALIAERIIEFQNERGNFETGTGIGITHGESAGSTGSYTAGPIKSALACIQDVAQGFDGFDWYILPLEEPESRLKEAGRIYMREIGLFIAAAVIGEEKPNVAFEYGIGKRNMRMMNFLKDQTTRANIIWNVSELGTEATAANPTPYIEKIDATNYSRYGIYEDVAELSGVNNVAMREQYVQEAVNVRKNPRQVLSMTSDFDDGTGRVPKFGIDYWLGDLVQARGVDEGFTLFSGLTRIYSVQVKINNAGTASYTPILVQESEQ